jgi:hypothetical protein
MSKIAIFLLIFCLLAVGVYAADEVSYTQLSLTIKDAQTDAIVKSLPATLNFVNTETSSEINVIKHLSSNGVIEYTLSPGDWKLKLMIDDGSTPAMDYYTEHLFLTDNQPSLNQTIYVIPVGGVEGVVIGTAQNLIKGADIDFKCSASLDIDFPDKTDQFGAFSADIVPVGKCKVSAAHVNLVGSQSLEVVQGELTDAIIKLDRPAISIIKLSWGYVIVLLAAIALVVLSIFWRRKARAKKKKEEEKKKRKRKPAVKKEEKPQASVKEAVEKVRPLTQRAVDVMKTLNEREQEVVRFLLENNNKSTQSKIRNSTGIPKTSLARIFTSLEGKNVISIETIGKLKKIELTDWFLGK